MHLTAAVQILSQRVPFLGMSQSWGRKIFFALGCMQKGAFFGRRRPRMLPLVTPNCLLATLSPMFSAAKIPFLLRVAQCCFHGPDIVLLHSRKKYALRNTGFIRARTGCQCACLTKKRLSGHSRVARARIGTQQSSQSVPTYERQSQSVATWQ